ncbi:MAG: ABC transporter ATP-binding protein [Deltaproteobacteria bacterium]|nr:ABC transporter ATP-binding protein [Deltaproteobacteria bacterium]
MLELKDVNIHYGQVKAVKGVSLSIQEKEIDVIIGSNGAGKSTILRGISGLIPCANGEIWFKNRRINNISGHRVAKMGISHVPEGRRLFPKMTVLENLKIGAYLRVNKREINNDLERILERFPVLRERRDQHAGTLSGGEQQMLTIGRGLMSKPDLLLLDEPSLGLAPLMVAEIARIIQEIHNQEMTIILVEQNARLALRLSNRGYVLETGKIVLEGGSEDLLGNEYVKKSYLGA